MDAGRCLADRHMVLDRQMALRALRLHTQIMAGSSDQHSGYHRRDLLDHVPEDSASVLPGE
jgi:hypothetical protein